eukprot:12405286-Karenia_brevis.AAC.1
MQWRKSLRERLSVTESAGCAAVRSCDWASGSAARGSSFREHGVPDVRLLPIDQMAVPEPTAAKTKKKSACVMTTFVSTNAESSIARKAPRNGQRRGHRRMECQAELNHEIEACSHLLCLEQQMCEQLEECNGVVHLT